MKANNIDAVKKAVSNWDAVTVPTEIGEKEGGHYHILLVEEVHRPDLKKYLIRQSVIKMNQTDYITKIGGKGKKGGKAPNFFALLGYTNHFIFHDPTIKVAPKKKASPKKETPTEEA